MLDKLIKLIGPTVKAQIPIITLWGIKEGLNVIKNKATYEVTLQGETLEYDQLEDWLFRNHSNKFQNVGLVKTSDNSTLFEPRNDSFLIWYNSNPIYISKVVEVNEKSYHKRESGTYVLKSILNKEIISELLKEVSNSYVHNDEIDDRLTVYLYTHYWKTHKQYYPKSINDVVLDVDVRSSIFSSIDTWKDDNKLLKSKKINTSLTHLYYGPPGSGKSSITASIAHHYGMNVYYLDLSSLLDIESLKDAFDQVQLNSIILIEDIDLVYKGRERINKSGVKFDAFINFLSGVLAKNDVMIIITTNHIEHLDPALIRAGRVDLKCEFKRPDSEMIIEFIRKFYEIELESFEMKVLPESMADVEQLCIMYLRDSDILIDKLKTGEWVMELPKDEFIPLKKSKSKSKKKKKHSNKSSKPAEGISKLVQEWNEEED